MYFELITAVNKPSKFVKTKKMIFAAYYKLFGSQNTNSESNFLKKMNITMYQVQSLFFNKSWLLPLSQNTFFISKYILTSNSWSVTQTSHTKYIKKIKTFFKQSLWGNFFAKFDFSTSKYIENDSRHKFFQMVYTDIWGWRKADAVENFFLTNLVLAYQNNIGNGRSV